MSKFSDRLNDARGKESIRAVSARAAKIGSVGESTLYPYFRAEHPRPTMPVVMALALALHIPLEELRELAGLPTEGQPWTPPDESRFMDDRQRRAVTELIRSFVKTQGVTSAASATQPQSPADSSAQPDASDEAPQDQEVTPPREGGGALLDFTPPDVDDLGVAAQKGTSLGRRLRDAQDQDAERES